MVKLTRLNQNQIVINAEMIEFVEAIPDTIVTLASGKKLMVTESVDEVIDKVIAYRRSCGEPLFSSA